MKVLKVESLGITNEPVYDLTVENTHNYLVGEDSVVAHNSGVGRSYDDDIILINWDNAPDVRCVIDDSHPDYDYSAHESVRDAKHKYGSGKDVLWHIVEDTREGWAKALEIWENAAFEKIHKDKLLILDFSKVRAKGSPIKGMQGRPASGPVPLMNAFMKALTIKNSGLPKFMQSMYIDHYFAECVLVGGARRAARMSTKYWKDNTIFDFITIKRPIEYCNKQVDEIVELRSSLKIKPNGFLWSSNNSIMVDKEFWNLLNLRRKDEGYNSPLAKHARKVFKLATSAAYGDGTGEPGFINVDKLTTKSEGIDKLQKGEILGSKKYQVSDDTNLYLSRLVKKALKKPYYMIVNPCGEIAIALWGAFCTIGDGVPFHADTIEEAEEGFKAIVRALIRVNTMDSIYHNEVKRTNRIGVGITGVHEFAWKFFKLGFRDLVDEVKSREFWATLSKFKRAIQEEAVAYSKKYNVVVPHTDTTIKPAGTNSKLFGLTEGWHLPSMRWYMRWVQFSESDPLIKVYEKNGYPIKHLKQYKNTIIVGFPTTPIITELGMGDALVTAAEATPEEQYKWISFGEKYWIHGVDKEGVPLVNNTGNQISYTLKYDPKIVDYTSFTKTLKEWQSKVKCCSIMPQEEKSSYEYLPEQPVTKAEYESVVNNIKRILEEDVDFAHVDCSTGACPVNFNK